MPGKPDTDDWHEQIQFHPWWRAVGENASKSSSADQLNGSPSLPGTNKTGAIIFGWHLIRLVLDNNVTLLLLVGDTTTYIRIRSIHSI